MRGFNIFELMVAVAILGFIAGLAIPSYQNYVFRARSAELISVATKLQNNYVQLYDAGKMISSINDLNFTGFSSEFIDSITFSSTTGSCTDLANSTLLGGFTIVGNSNNIGISGEMNLVISACLLDFAVHWECNSSAATVGDGNSIYFPIDCQDGI